MSRSIGSRNHPNPVKIGWSETDITTQTLPVEIRGQFHTRISEGIKDPLTATACVIDTQEDHLIFVSCDIISIPEEVTQGIRKRVSAQTEEIDPSKIILHATHTHTSVALNSHYELFGGIENRENPAPEVLKDLIKTITSSETTKEWFISTISSLILESWKQRRPGAIAYGLDYAVIGRNRRWVDKEGKSNMYLHPEKKESFSHIEGYEDHSVNLISTYDENRNLTGILLNIPSPSQEEENGYALSADFWKETRDEIRKRLKKNIFILPQVSAAGDLTSHLLYEKEAHQRMLHLRNYSARQEIAERIANAVDRILPVIEQTQESALLLKHIDREIPLPLNALTIEDLKEAEREIEQYDRLLEEEIQRLKNLPDYKKEPRWYINISRLYGRKVWYKGVVQRYQLQKENPLKSVEVHLVRLGDIAFATNPFELYLDYGIEMKLRSPAIQTFLIQLAGAGTYLPSPRSVPGGGYGSVPASNPIGPEGGKILVEETLRTLKELFLA